MAIESFVGVNLGAEITSACVCVCVVAWYLNSPAGGSEAAATGFTP